MTLDRLLPFSLALVVTGCGSGGSFDPSIHSVQSRLCPEQANGSERDYIRFKGEKSPS
jgi:hypothetical protein